MKKRFLILISLILDASFALGMQTNKYYFKHLDIDDGLSQSSVLCILQDRTGFMWFGTKDGLNRYDGVTSKTFMYETSGGNGLGNNVINTMYENNDGCIWIGTDAGIYIYNPEKELLSSFPISINNGVPITKPVFHIAGDIDGNIWFTVESQGMYCVDGKSNKLKHYPIKLKDGSTADIVSFCIDQQKTIWLGLKNKGLYYTNNLFKDISPLNSANSERNSFENDVIYKIIPENHNHLYIGSFQGGFKKVNIVTKEVSELLSRTSQNHCIFVRHILKVSDSEFWIGTENGIYIYDIHTNNYTLLKHDGDDFYSLSDNAIYAIYKDREGGIWVGSYFGGIDYYPPKYTYFEKYYPLLKQNSISGKVVREFCQDNEGNLWIGTEDAGLNKFNPKTKQFTPYKNDELYHNIHALCLDNDKLWVGTFSMGLYVIDMKTNRLIKLYMKENKSGSINDNSIFSMCKSSLGVLFIGTQLGLNIYKPETDSFEDIKEMRGIFVFDILEDQHGYIWFASYTSGLFRYNPRNETWKKYSHNPDKPNSLPYDKVISLFEDSKGKLWITMQGGGFCSFDPQTESFKQYSSTKHSLPNDVVYKIIEDDNKIFWLTTNKGLTRFNPENEQFSTYTTANGLLGNQFNYSSGIKTPNGQIYFGGTKGFISFNPETFTENKSISPIVITDFLLFNKRAAIDEQGSPLKKSIIFTDDLELSYKQNSFAFRFASLSFIAPETNDLSYKLEGFDKEWYNASENLMATYTNLKPGEYTFCVKYVDCEDQDEIKKISIIINPPFWQTKLAYILYVIFISLITWLTMRRFKRRMIRKQKYQLEKLESEKEKEIYHAKVNFFTDVAHEIRTPLTLIKGPLESILKKNNLEDEVKEDLNVMEQNTLRLLNLTNQLLDFRKTEVKGFSLNFMSCNISDLLRETHARFLPTAKKNNLKFELIFPEKDFYAPVDREALTKIISNLFTNAIKYSKNYIKVTLLSQSKYNANMFSISVANDGDDIPEEMKEKIFKPFVQAHNHTNNKTTTGTGIGLALARSLVELHKGHLFLEEDIDDISFYAEIPIEQNHLIIDEKYDMNYETKTTIENKSHFSKTILVIEDDAEMIRFICRQLNESYNVIAASNGLEALDILDKNTIDVIVSDVMMPKMDGFELCAKLKSDISYSHIPFILLTAKANLQSKIEGIELGADDYIEKPFSTEYLLARIANLLTAQEKRYKTFASSPFIEAKSIALSKTDEDFLERLTDIINKNLSEPNFNVDILAEQMNMSRSSLHRKIKGLSQLTPNEFIQLERLKKAAQLIRSGDYRINEVCYIVGFSSSSYFAKCFQKQFGVLPKDFGKS